MWFFDHFFLLVYFWSFNVSKKQLLIDRYGIDQFLRSKVRIEICVISGCKLWSLNLELLLGNQDQRSHPIVRILLGFTFLPFLFFSLFDPSTKILSSFPSLPPYIHSPILSKRFPRLSTETELPTTFAFSLSFFYNIIRHMFHDELLLLLQRGRLIN